MNTNYFASVFKVYVHLCVLFACEYRFLRKTEALAPLELELQKVVDCGMWV